MAILWICCFVGLRHSSILILFPNRLSLKPDVPSFSTLPLYFASILIFRHILSPTAGEEGGFLGSGTSHGKVMGWCRRQRWWRLLRHHRSSSIHLGRSRCCCWIVGCYWRRIDCRGEKVLCLYLFICCFCLCIGLLMLKLDIEWLELFIFWFF